MNSHGRHLTASGRSSLSNLLLCVPTDFDPISFECVHFQGLSQIIANLARENLAERETEITNLPWAQTDKDNALARCIIGQRAWRNKKTRALP